MRGDSPNALRALFGFDLAFASESFGAAGMDFVVWHPPWAAIVSRQIGAALVFAEPFDEMIALADVERTGAGALEDVNEVHEMKSGRDDWI